MLEKNKDTVLFIHGINSRHGGANQEVLISWVQQLRDEFDKVSVFHIDPWFISRTTRIRAFFSILWYLPGSFFRLFHNPIFEYLYKLSPFTLISFLMQYIRISPTVVIFNHHSVFYLSLIIPKKKRIYISHDSLYKKSNIHRSLNALKKYIFNTEMMILSKATKIFFLSYHEHRFFNRYLSGKCTLIHGATSNLIPYYGKYDPYDIAIIGDWRRPVNIRGLLKFFDNYSLVKLLLDEKYSFTIYGINSFEAYSLLKKINVNSYVGFHLGGIYKDFKDIPQGFIFVPVYEGAGIKSKVIESLINSRIVIGTPKAFVGVPWDIIVNHSRIVWTISDFLDLSKINLTPFNSDTFLKYRNLYKPIAKSINTISI